MKQKNKEVKIGNAPFPDGKSAEPIYANTIPAGLTKPFTNPTFSGAEPMAAGSLKTPENTSAKTQQMDKFRVQGENKPLTSSHGVNIADNQNSLKAGERALPFLKISFLMKSWRTLIASGFQSGWCMRVGPERMDIFRYTHPSPNIQKQLSCRIQP